jgi:hypothetical protein
MKITLTMLDPLPNPYTSSIRKIWIGKNSEWYNKSFSAYFFKNNFPFAQELSVSEAI